MKCIRILSCLVIFCLLRVPVFSDGEQPPQRAEQEAAEALRKFEAQYPGMVIRHPESVEKLLATCSKGLGPEAKRAYSSVFLLALCQDGPLHIGAALDSMGDQWARDPVLVRRLYAACMIADSCSRNANKCLASQMIESKLVSIYLKNLSEPDAYRYLEIPYLNALVELGLKPTPYSRGAYQRASTYWDVLEPHVGELSRRPTSIQSVRETARRKGFDTTKRLPSMDFVFCSTPEEALLREVDDQLNQDYGVDESPEKERERKRMSEAVAVLKRSPDHILNQRLARLALTTVAAPKGGGYAGILREFEEEELVAPATITFLSVPQRTDGSTRSKNEWREIESAYESLLNQHAPSAETRRRLAEAAAFFALMQAKEFDCEAFCRFKKYKAISGNTETNSEYEALVSEIASRCPCE